MLHSLQFGNTYLSYEALPIWVGLAAIGNYQDADRYENFKGDEMKRLYRRSY